MTIPTNNSAENSPEFTPHAGREPVFGVGNRELTQEVYQDGKRILKWVRHNGNGSDETKLAPLAGWAELPHGTDEEGLGYLEIPAGARTASSVLSGLEAWEGEKAHVLNFISDYQQRVHRFLSVYDTGVILDSVAVSPEQYMFVAPPHHVTNIREEAAEWFTAIMSDLDSVLSNEPNRQQLLELFQQNIEKITRGA